MTQDVHNMFSAHHSKTMMSSRLLLHIFLPNGEWITCMSSTCDVVFVGKHTLIVTAIGNWRLLQTPERLPQGKFNKAMQPISTSFCHSLTSELKTESFLLRRCWATYVMWCAPPQKCNYSTHQGYRDVCRQKELRLTLTRWCFVFPAPHTFSGARRHAAGWRKAK